jgi:hypothetical protein
MGSNFGRRGGYPEILALSVQAKAVPLKRLKYLPSAGDKYKL